jgi:hypothetical protein
MTTDGGVAALWRGWISVEVDTTVVATRPNSTQFDLVGVDLLARIVGSGP